MTMSERLAVADARHRSRAKSIARDVVGGPAVVGDRSARASCSWLARQRAAWVRMRREGYGWDEVLLSRAIRLVTVVVWYGYTFPRGFLLAHALGWVPRAVRDYRRVRCQACEFRRTKDGQDYCFGDHGGRGCGCPRGRYWPFSELRWLVWLANRPCPIGAFPRFVPRLALILRILTRLRRAFERSSRPA